MDSTKPTVSKGSPPALLPADSPERAEPSSRIGMMFNDDESDRIQRVYANHREAVCMIVREDGKTGTGCLIGGDLIITNHHVLDSKDTTRRSEAIFFYVTQQSADKKDTDLAVRCFELRPDVFFVTSKDAKDDRDRPLPASAGCLDYTIVAIEHKEHLARIQTAALSIFDSVEPTPGHGACVIHHPKKIDHNTYIERDRKKSEGRIVCNAEFTTYYNAETASGSSGGVVVDLKGRLVALHYQGDCNCECIEGHCELNSGVLAERIINDVRHEKAINILRSQIATSTKTLEKLAPVSISSQQNNVPMPTKDFTGREDELQALDEAFTSHKRAVITGLGGVGKTALVQKYASSAQCVYKLKHFIQGLDRSAIRSGLIAFADEQHLLGENGEKKLTKLKEFLKQHPSCLLIFDGVDTEDGFEFLEEYLPKEVHSIIVTSRMPGQGEHLLNCVPVPVKEFSLDDAVAFIQKATNQSKNSQDLADVLGRLPLALKHACSYINARGISIDDFLKGFETKQTAIFREKFPKSKEQTILTTWSMCMVFMSPETIELFNACSHLGPADIPKDLLAIWGNKYHPTWDINTSIQELLAYSMMTATKPGGYNIHGLVKQVVRGNTALGSSVQEATYIVRQYLDKFDCNEINTWEYAGKIEAHAAHVVKKSEVESEVAGYVYYWLGRYAYFIVEDYSKAIADYNQSLEVLAEAHKGEERTEVAAAILCAIGQVLQAQGKLDEALEKYQNALEIQTETYKSERHTEVAATLHAIGQALQAQGRFDEALEKHQKALEILAKAYKGEDHIEVAATLHSIGQVLQAQGKLAGALEKYQKALKVRTKAYKGEDHTEVAMTLGSIGQVLQLQGKLDEALEKYQKALKIRTKAYKGEDHTEVATILGSIGQVLQLQGKLDEALEQLQKALEIQTKVYKGEDHIGVAATLHAIGQVLTAQGKFDEALEQFQKALEIQTKAYKGEDHAKVAATLCAIGQVLQIQGKLDEALEKHQKALEIQTKAYKDEDHTSVAETLCGIAGVLRDQGKLDEALEQFQKALEIQTKAYKGEDHIEVAATLHAIGQVLQAQGKLDEALEKYQKVLAIETNAYKGEDHIGVAATLHSIGQVLQAQGKLDEALEHFKKTLVIFKAGYRENHPITIAAIYSVGALLFTQNRLAEAAPYLEHLERLSHLLPRGVGIPVIQLENRVMLTQARKAQQGVDLHQQGLLHKERGELDEAKKLLTEAHDILHQLRAPEAEACYTDLVGVARAIDERDLATMQLIAEDLLGDLD